MRLRARAGPARMRARETARAELQAVRCHTRANTRRPRARARAHPTAAICWSLRGCLIFLPLTSFFLPPRSRRSRPPQVVCRAAISTDTRPAQPPPTAARAQRGGGFVISTETSPTCSASSAAAMAPTAPRPPAAHRISTILPTPSGALAKRLAAEPCASGSHRHCRLGGSSCDAPRGCANWHTQGKNFSILLV